MKSNAEPPESVAVVVEVPLSFVTESPGIELEPPAAEAESDRKPKAEGPVIVVEPELPRAAPADVGAAAETTDGVASIGVGTEGVSDRLRPLKNTEEV